MKVILILLVYAALVVLVVPLILRRAGWVQRAPGLGIVVWQALAASGLLSMLVAALALAVLSPQPSQRGFAAGGAVSTLSVTVCAAVGLGRTVGRARRQARRLTATVALVGRPLPELGPEVVAVEHPQPAAYCLTGRRGQRRIVVTSAALGALERSQLRAVVAHERAHLRERHHLVLLAADAFGVAFPILPLFRLARREVAVLVEMRADDVAAHQHGRASVASALVSVANGSVPGSVLAAGGGGGGVTALRRIRRMLGPSRPLGVVARAGGLVGAALSVAFPLSLACLPVTVAVYLAVRVV